MNKSRNFNRRKSNSKDTYKKDRNQKEQRTSTNSRLMQETEHSYNDVRWYVPSEELLKSAASISFENATGDSNIVGNTRIPGIYAVDLALTFGVTKDALSPLNTCARQAYTKLMTGVTSYAPFESNDYMLYLMALDSVYSEFNAIKRAYGVIRHFEYKNKYTPEALLNAMGLDYESWKNNLSDIWFSLNYWSNQISKFAVPQIMSIFIRHSWLSTNIYKDGSNDKNQMYLFNPSVVYQIEDDPTVGLKLTGINSGFGVHQSWANPKPLRSTWAQVKSIMNDMVEKISQEQDFEIISSYILKQYSNNLFTLGSTPADYEITAVYDESVLLQIHNSTNYLPASAGSFDITQVVDKDAGVSYLVSDPKNELPLVDNYDLYIDLMDKEAEPSIIMEATRLTATGKGGSSQGTYTSFGGDVVYRTGIVYYDGAPSVGASLKTVQDVSTYATVAYFKASDSRLKTLALRSKFNYAPAIMVIKQDAPENVGEVLYSIGDLGNYQVVHSNELTTLDNVAMMGLLGLLS